MKQLMVSSSVTITASSSGRKSEVYELIEAVSAGNLRRIKKLVKDLDKGKGTSETIAKVKDLDGRGVLHLAAIKGRTNVCKYLLEELKLRVDEKDAEDCTPLLHASLEGHLNTVVYLIEKGANPGALNLHNTTALHLAALEGNMEMIQLLLSKGADVNAPSDIGTPLQVAAQICKADVLKTLLDHGANANPVNFNPTPLDFSLSRSLECSKLLIQAGADPNGSSCGMRPLESAAKEGKIELVNFLLESRADPDITNDAFGLKPLEIAAWNGNHREVGILFPVTSPIAACPEWSINGIMKYVHSGEVVQQIAQKVKEMHLKAKSNGEDALQRKDYLRAAFYDTEAIALDPSDATVLLNRSLCSSYLGIGAVAWRDAKACLTQRPDWPEAFYRGGVASCLLGNFEMAADLFQLGLKLDPENKDLQDAVWTTGGGNKYSGCWQQQQQQDKWKQSASQ